ncbi:hypothetical protein PMAYCL1PPCAC_07764, partial [Pristionchus mayeri]
VYLTIDSRPQDDEDPSEKNLDPSTVPMHISFQDVSYTFPSRCQSVLHGLSFDLSPGESLALVGQSGCGKSTTLKLVKRFLSPASGSILLDGEPLERFDKRKLREMIGVVSQEPSLFHGICLGRPFSQ